MAELRDYRVVVNGNETVMSLTEEDAERLGGTLVEGSSQPEAKSRTTANKSRSTNEKSTE